MVQLKKGWARGGGHQSVIETRPGLKLAPGTGFQLDCRTHLLPASADTWRFMEP